MSKASLHHIHFVGKTNVESGQISHLTTFHYRQYADTIWANYKGGAIRYGVLAGRRVGNNLFFDYHHQDTQGQIKTGKCQSLLKIVNGQIELHESWQWHCDDYATGISIVAEWENL